MFGPVGLDFFAMISPVVHVGAIAYSCFIPSRCLYRIQYLQMFRLKGIRDTTLAGFQVCIPIGYKLLLFLGPMYLNSTLCLLFI